MAGESDHEKLNEAFDEELRRIAAVEAVLDRKGLKFDFSLWQNEMFQTDLKQWILAELAPDPGGIRRFLSDFEAQIEDLDARWLMAQLRQKSGQLGVNMGSLLKEYQEIYTKDLFQRLKTMGKTRNIELDRQHRLNLWQQVTERELADVALESQRTKLRDVFDTYSFPLGGRQHAASEISAKILWEEADRSRRLETWRNLAQLSEQVESHMRDLWIRTNAFWQEQEYPNATTPRLQVIGVSEAVVNEIVTNIEKVTRLLAQETINEYRDFLGHEITPWDWRFAAARMIRPFEQVFKKMDEITCARQTYEQLGIMLDQLPIMITGLATIDSAIHYYIRIPHDIVFAYGPVSGYRKLLVLLRGLGRVCCFAYIDESLAYPFRRYAPLVLSEGIGTLISWIIWQPGWLESFTNLSGEQIETFIRLTQGYEILKIRHYAALAEFEAKIYPTLAKDEQSDLNELYKLCMEHFFFFPHDRYSTWAAEPRLIEPFPFFIQYVLALAVAANLLDYFQREGISLLSPHFGDVIRSDLVRLGSSSSWVERLQHLTARAITLFPKTWSSP